MAGAARGLGLPAGAAAGLLRSHPFAPRLAWRRHGPRAYYRLAGLEVYRLLATLRQVAESRLSEIDAILQRYLGPRELLEGVSAEELLRRVRSGEAVLIDVRPVDEYRAGHLPGALAMPLDELEAHLEALPRDREVIAYCRGRYCVFADEAVAILRRHGLRARRMEEGPADWRLDGLPVEEGDSHEG